MKDAYSVLASQVEGERETTANVREPRRDRDVGAHLFDRLTEKEREVLELVHARLSSKEIGLRLNLSRKTVDQRLDNARGKLGAPTRMAAARLYADLAGIPERFPCAPFPVSEPPSDQPERARAPTDATYTFGDSMTFTSELPWHRSRPSVAPEFWALRLGALPRLAIILAGAVGLLVLVLLGLSLSEGMSNLLRS